MTDAVETAAIAAKYLGVPVNSVYVCSTGVIGTPMPMDRIRPKLAELAGTPGSANISDVAAAIMTTDTFPKIVAKRKKIGSKTVTITGICKGAGMIQPNMATMLCFIVTDAKLAPAVLRAALKETVRTSFNRVTIDGDMSTNDTVLIMANGFAANETIKSGTKDSVAFVKALSDVTYELAVMIAKDGEGMTKFLIAEVKNAKNEKEAERAAFAIANSLLVKTAVYGNDANWGRIMAAIGYSGITLKEEKVDVYLNGLRLAKNGTAAGVDAEANDRLKAKDVVITVDLHLGKGSAKVLSCDLTEEYIKINAEYRT